MLDLESLSNPISSGCTTCSLVLFGLSVAEQEAVQQPQPCTVHSVPVETFPYRVLPDRYRRIRIICALETFDPSELQCFCWSVKCSASPKATLTTQIPEIRRELSLECNFPFIQLLQQQRRRRRGGVLSHTSGHIFQARPGTSTRVVPEFIHVHFSASSLRLCFGCAVRDGSYLSRSSPPRRGNTARNPSGSQSTSSLRESRTAPASWPWQPFKHIERIFGFKKK